MKQNKKENEGKGNLNEANEVEWSSKCSKGKEKE